MSWHCLYSPLSLTLALAWLFCSCTPAKPTASPENADLAQATQQQEEEENSPLGIQPPSIPALLRSEEKVPHPEEAGEQLQLAGRNWLYGNGFGKTVINVGTVVLFPPYALYLLGNAGLALAGYETLSISDALPDRERGYVQKAYNGITSVPGRLSAVLANEEYRGK
jgi:hypothetical protein